MKIRRGWIVIVLFLLGTVVFAQRIWEGSATVARYGEFPPSGLFGASNSFERNSIVDVENLATGKRVRLIITGRVTDPTLFLVVSEQAASELGMERADIARVRVSPVVTPGIDPSALQPELPLSPDPDVNPAARIARTPPAAGVIPTPRAPADRPTPVPPIAAPEALQPTPADPWKESASINPYSELVSSLEKREQPVFSSLEVVLESREPPAEPEPVAEAIAKIEPPVEAPDAEVVAPPAMQEVQVKPPLLLEPVGEGPPPEKPPEREEQKLVVEAPPPQFPFTTKTMAGLQKGAYYLQIGSFSRPESVQTLWERFKDRFPLVVLQDAERLRFLVGPLTDDEKGITNSKFRFLGFRDIFFIRNE